MPFALCFFFHCITKCVSIIDITFLVFTGPRTNESRCNLKTDAAYIIQPVLLTIFSGQSPRKHSLNIFCTGRFCHTLLNIINKFPVMYGKSQPKGKNSEKGYFCYVYKNEQILNTVQKENTLFTLIPYLICKFQALKVRKPN